MSTAATPKLKSDVLSAFKSVGAEVTDALTTRIAALSTQLRLSPQKLAEAWEAHSLTKNVSVLDDVSFAAYRSSLSGLAGENNNRVVGTSSAKRKAGPSSVTPTPNKTKIKRENEQQPQLATPSSSTPAGKNILITPTKTPTYQERTNQGAVVSTYNPHDLPTAASSSNSSHIAASIQYHPSSSHPTKSYRHMFTPLEARAQVLEERLATMTEQIQAAHSDGDDVVKQEAEAAATSDADSSTWAPVGIPMQNTVRCVGRICNEVIIGIDFGNYVSTSVHHCHLMLTFILVHYFTSGTRRKD
jgi:hypothetical protein